MALPHARSGEVVNVSPLGAALRRIHSSTLVTSDDLEVFRLVMAAGTLVPDRKEPRVWELTRSATVQCLEGAVEVSLRGGKQCLRPGDLLYLAGGEAQALEALEDSSLLVTMLVSREALRQDPAQPG